MPCIFHKARNIPGLLGIKSNCGGKSIRAHISYLKPKLHACDGVLFYKRWDTRWGLKNNHETVERKETNPDILATADSQSAA